MNRMNSKHPEALLKSAYNHHAAQPWFPLAVSSFKAWSPGAILLFAYFGTGIALRFFPNVPLHDDWTYAWSVEHFLKTGKLQVLDWSVHYPFAQILWGALFCLPFGFSFSALRVSTVVLASIGALTLYGTLRELGRPRNESLIATLVLVANPAFFALTFSFMTDVPFVSVANIAFFFIVRGFCRKKSLELCLGCVFALMAFFIRQIAIAIPGAVLLYVLLAPSLRSGRYILPLIILALLMGLTTVFIADTVGFSSQYAGRTWVLYEWINDYELGIPGLLRVFTYGGLALFPITFSTAGALYRRPVYWAVMAFLSLLTLSSLLFTPDIPKPLEGMWHLITLGKERVLLRGFPDPDLPSWLNYPLFALSILSSAVIITRVIDIAGTAIEDPLWLFVWYTLLQLLLMMALWLFDAWGSDRYSVVLLPALLIVLICSCSQHRAHLTLLGIAVIAFVSMLITWNETQTSRTVAEALRWLRQKNIALADIDAGYVFNGWNLYAHPENLPSGAVPERDVPLVTSNQKKSYVIAASPINGYKILREYGWPIPLRSLTQKIYVLEQIPE